MAASKHVSVLLLVSLSLIYIVPHLVFCSIRKEAVKAPGLPPKPLEVQEVHNQCAHRSYLNNIDFGQCIELEQTDFDRSNSGT